VTPPRPALLALLAAAATAAVVSPAVAGDGSSRDVEQLVRRYYAAVAAEDMGRLAPLLWFADEAQAARMLGVYRAVFQATDAQLQALRIERVEADPAAGAAAAHVRTTSVIANHDRSDSFRKEAAHVVLCLRRDGRWRVAKVLRAPDYQMRMQLARFNRQLGQLQAASPPGAGTASGAAAPPGALDAAVAAEMRRIEALLGRGGARDAVGRMCGALVALWKRQQRARWRQVLAWVRQCRARFPDLDAAGRNRLDWLESDLAELVREEADWARTLAAVRGAADDAQRARLLQDYVRRHYGGFYRPDAEAALATLRRGRPTPPAPAP